MKAEDSDRVCTFCGKEFTAEDIATGDRMRNELAQPMHEDCYNRWCAANPVLHHFGKQQAHKAEAIRAEVDAMVWPDTVPG